jgi:hypothetical protein
MDLTTIFYHSDNFCKLFEKEFEIKVLSTGIARAQRECCLTLGEVMAIVVYYHRSGYKTFKDYYTRSHELQSGFSNMPSYNRFIELQQKIIVPLQMFFKLLMMQNQCTGVSFIDSFPLPVSHIKRASSHKTFANLARKGKTSTGWFYGFKIHVVINEKGEVLDFLITAGNIADNNKTVIRSLTKRLHGKAFGDRGYLLTAAFFREIYQKGVHVVTKIRKNMVNKLMPLADKLMLRKRGLIETVGAVLKEDCNIQHTRYRSPITFLINVFSAMIAYSLSPKKPSIRKKDLVLIPS